MHQLDTAIKRDLVQRNELPTLQQLRYLIELEEVIGQKGNISRVAEKCNVNISSVSRFFRACQDRGCLNQDNTFTKQGAMWVQAYKRVIIRLPIYLKELGLGENEIPKHMQDMIENLEIHVLEAMLQNIKKPKVKLNQRDKSEKIVDILEQGNQDIGYTMFKYGKKNDFSISMADRAFEKPALLSNNKRGRWIYLYIKEMEETSRVYKTLMSGILKTLKYEKDGVVHSALIKDNKVRIPLDAFCFRKRPGGEIRGELPIMVTCSVGRIHMPESTALLVIWL